MKITFFIPNLRVGGAENVLRMMINALIDRYPQYTVSLCLASANGEIASKIDKRITIINFSRSNVRYCLYDLIQYFRREKPDCFVVSLDYANIIASFAHKLSRSKSKLILWEHSVTSIHSQTTISKFFILRYFLVNYFYKRAHYIIAVSKGIAKDMVSNFCIPEEKLYIIYNPIECNEIIQLANQKEVDCYPKIDKEQYIISVGRLVQAKNYPLLINAYSLLAENNVFKLIIVGDGPEKQHLQQLISELNLDGRVVLVGHLNNPFPLMKNAESVILSSSWEGFSLVLIETLALKKNIVSTDCPSGPREILGNGEFGLLVPMNNPEKLAEGISQIINGEVKFDEDLLLQRAQYFSIEKSFNQFMEIIH